MSLCPGSTEGFYPTTGRFHHHVHLLILPIIQSSNLNGSTFIISALLTIPIRGTATAFLHAPLPFYVDPLAHYPRPGQSPESSCAFGVIAETVLKHISEDKVYPNLRTYVNLATGCGQPEEGFQLLKEMEEAGIEATCHLYGALIGSTQKHRNYHYLIDVLKHMEAQGVLPNERVLTQLEKIAAFGQNKVGQTMRSSRPVNKKELNLFRGFYNQWLSRMKVQVPEHPWAKYRTKDKTLEDYKFHETAV
eukprot:XP_011678528.1 PREDICTED: pentatricopeptide repeat-containing protein 1, mitochondrial [Strongylocentrotus purpuratus]